MLPDEIHPNMRVKVVAGRYFGLHGVTRPPGALMRTPTELAVSVDLDGSKGKVQIVPGHLTPEEPE
jgi:hypothetical protein